ncbi:ABC transporter substrate-binding protein [Devosia sp. 2618]|uniref:ABC transporter substrate-binding protein n=1 Tax=Devosia sp. 2618 TaxID=3156454 RepID=UPI0033956F58
MRRTIARALLAATIGTAAIGIGYADDLSIAVKGPITSFDPHYHLTVYNNAMVMHVYEGLVGLDNDNRPIPRLAESWSIIDENTWEFKLREATFHNGAPFTADDVKFTFDRINSITNSPGSYIPYIRQVSELEIVDQHTIRFHTTEPFPMMIDYLTQVPIVSHTLGENLDSPSFRNGDVVVGTGPYRLVSYAENDRVTLVRNEEYWGSSPAYENVSYRIMPNDAGRVAALLAGDVQLVDAVPSADLDQLSSNPDIHVTSKPAKRIIFIGLNQLPTGKAPQIVGPNGEALDTNPLLDVRVRKALSIAIDRRAIVEFIMKGEAVANGQVLPPDSFGYNEDLPPPAANPETARALLAEAGYPHGFRITLHAPTDRFVNGPEIVQAVAQMWARIGVQTSVETLPYANYIPQINNAAYPTFLMGWSSVSNENSLNAMLATWNPEEGRGSTNRGQYSNPEVDDLITRILSTVDEGAREELMHKVQAIAAEDVAFIPLHIQTSAWASSADVHYDARRDEKTYAMDARAE